MPLNLKETLYRIFFRPAERDATAPLDGLRALSFIWVFGIHFISLLFLHSPIHLLEEYMSEWPILVSIFMRGNLAVDIFHILSAYLITTALVREYHETKTVKLVRFWIKRFFRLAPYNLILLALLLMLGWMRRRSLDPIMANAWANILFVQNFIPFTEMFLLHTWTQALEFQFAIVYAPLLAWLLSRSQQDKNIVLKAFIGLLILFPFIRGYFIWQLVSSPEGLRFPMKFHSRDWRVECPHPSTVNYFSTIYSKLWTRYSSFILGGLLGYLHSTKIDFRYFSIECTTTRCIFSLLCLTWGLIPRVTSHDGEDYFYPTWFMFPYLMTTRLSFGIGMTLILHWCMQLNNSQINGQASKLAVGFIRGINRFLSWRGWYPIATISFVAYINHVLIVTGIMIGSKNKNPLTNLVVVKLFLVSFVVTFVSSIIIFVVAENPIQQYLSTTPSKPKKNISVS